MKWKPNQVFLPDLSHYEWPTDLNALAKSGCVAVIWKATEGRSYQDPSYPAARAAAYAAGLLWGAYHFGDASPVDQQVSNFLAYAIPTNDDMIILDFEDNSNNTMLLADAQNWITQVEDQQERPNEAVLYSGNRIKETLGDNPSPFWSARRLWLCQYGETPVVPKAWAKYWLWQFTDGSSGPTPHTVAGVSGGCDVNAYDSDEAQLKAEWSGHVPAPAPPAPGPPPTDLVVTMYVPAGVKIEIKQT